MTFGLAVTVYGGCGNAPSRFWQASLRVLSWLQGLWLVGHDRKHWDLKRRERWRERRKRRRFSLAGSGMSGSLLPIGFLAASLWTVRFMSGTSRRRLWRTVSWTSR